MRTLVLLLLVAAALAQSAPAPPRDRAPATIDYRKPDAYLKMPDRDGEASLIKKLAAPLKDKDAEQVFRNIHAYVARLPQVFEGWEPDHRDFGTLLAGFDHRNCAAHALVFASLVRGCGIPAVYVKSSRHEWIAKYVATGETGSFDGHVFLEVFVGDKWRLLDAQGMRIWDEYDPADPELPGGLLAYEKGPEHFGMVHSTRRDLFVSEAKERWRGFDPAKLKPNAAAGRPLLPRVCAISGLGEWKVLEQRVQGLSSFNRAAWPESKAKVKGSVFIVPAVAGKTDLPPEEAGAWLPPDRKGVSTRRLDDGTLVVLVSAPGWAELNVLLWSTDFEQIRADFGKGK
jgi:hypothetical protein